MWLPNRTRAGVPHGHRQKIDDIFQMEVVTKVIFARKHGRCIDRAAPAGARRAVGSGSGTPHRTGDEPVAARA